MKIFVKAKTGAKEEKVIPPAAKLWQENKNNGQDGKGWFTVWVKEPPVQGKANVAISKALGEYFKVGSSQIRLISGFSSKQKVFEIL